jgi:hypothetical protein
VLFYGPFGNGLINIKKADENKIELSYGQRNAKRHPFYGRTDLGFHQTFKMKDILEIQLKGKNPKSVRSCEYYRL